MKAKKKVLRPKLGAAWAEHIFLDIVGYSKRTVESQAKVVSALNRLVRRALAANRVRSDQRLLLPTGDGICITLLDVNDPYDLQMCTALAILGGLHKHNSQTPDEHLRFQVRVGINANRDNVVVDINGNPNATGAGINESQRVMSVADGGQILVGDAVFNMLKQRDRYHVDAFRPYPMVEMKHGVLLNAYQFVGGSWPFLNRDIPAAFRSPTDIKRSPKLKSAEAPTSLRQKGLVLRIEIGPSKSEVERAQATGVKLNDPLRIMALLDTGASATIISPQVAATCGLRQTGVAHVSSAGLLSKVPEFIGAIRFPELDLRDVDPARLLAVPFPQQQVACILGRDVLEKWRITYDGRTGEVEIEE